MSFLVEFLEKERETFLFHGSDEVKKVDESSFRNY